MKGLALGVTCLTFLLLGGCARHFVVERDVGRMDGDRSITTNSDTEWKVLHEPDPGEKESVPQAIMRRRSEPLPSAEIYRKVLLESRAAPLRAEAARELGERLAGDEQSIWALSAATNDEEPIVQQAARRALVRIFDARQQPETDDEDRLERLEDVAQEKAYQLGRGAIAVLKWLWENVYYSPA